ncbi:MAG: GntR family transcriptional regulator [Streptosporangiales bacterium]|nr:GntR family transcriptional regulator [Streptosporangiales bacterium]
MNERPRYRRVAADLRHKIETGEVQPGNRLPSESMLIESYKVSRNTVRKALGLLINEGLVGAHMGKGYFVGAPNDAHEYRRRGVTWQALARELIAFLRQQLDEDEQAARRVWNRYAAYSADVQVAEHLDRHDPFRVCRKVEAARRIIERYEVIRDGVVVVAARDPALRELLTVIRFLVASYDDRPGWHEEWRATAWGREGRDDQVAGSEEKGIAAMKTSHEPEQPDLLTNSPGGGPQELPAEVDDLFIGEAEWRIPELADRYAYKKESGSSDGYNTQDTIET